MKKITSNQIIDNLNSRLALLKSQGFNSEHPAASQLQGLMDDIARHNHAIENIEDSTARHTANTGKSFAV